MKYAEAQMSTDNLLNPQTNKSEPLRLNSEGING